MIKDYKLEIIETETDPTIAGTRVTIYDVMEMIDNGDDIFLICLNFDLTPSQVHMAIAYIEEHREWLEPELKKILKRLAEQEQHYRAIQEKIRAKIAKEPKTPLQKAFEELREKNRRSRDEYSTNGYQNGVHRNGGNSSIKTETKSETESGGGAYANTGHR
ncbi:MAG: DUF433 domain-containing protein [Chloroflexota bacterium]